MTEGTSSLFTHNVTPSFTIPLISSASMNVFKDNINEERNMQGEWRVAVTEITFPTQINNVTDNNIVYYKKDRVYSKHES